eukprot:13105072-Heterocapsa_arctica.AAC.1
MEAQNDSLAVFTKLAISFNIEDKVRDLLIAEERLGARTLDNFLHAAATQEEVAALATQANPDNKFLTTSRLRQAWLTLRQ